jgi:small subunit ribosomal protein S20
MNKEQRNKKDVKQNKRNRLINKRYISTIKSLNRLFVSKIKLIEIENDSKRKAVLKQNIYCILNKFYSFVDKGVKKGLVHKNTAARKKSNFNRAYKTLNNI